MWVELSDKVAATEFDGYDNDVIEGAKVVAIVRNGESVESAAAGEDVEVVLDRTPFYAEMGGQQGDAGELSAEGVSLTVSDTKNHNGLYAHVAHVAEGTLAVGATVTAALDAERRGSCAATTPPRTCSTPPLSRSWASTSPRPARW